MDFRPVHFFTRPQTQVGQIADALLSVGMQPDEVSKVLKEHQIEGMSAAGGFTITHYYQTGRPEDPILAVHFRRDAKRVYRVTEWSTEKMVSVATAAEPPRPIQRVAFGPRPSLEHVQHIPGLTIPPPPIKATFRRTYLRVHSQEQLQHIANSCLAIGMSSHEVSETLEEQSVVAQRTSSSSHGTTTSYAGGKLEDPVLVVRFRRDTNGDSRVTEWSTEK